MYFDTPTQNNRHARAQTDNDSFAAFFSQYGEVESALVMREKFTHKSRGFGFVSFVHRAGVQKVRPRALRALSSASQTRLPSVYRSVLYTDSTLIFRGFFFFFLKFIYSRNFLLIKS